MNFRRLLSLAWRESRFARRRLFLFLSAISLGVAALVAVQGFGANMQREVRNEAREMLGADVSLSSREPFDQTTEALIDSVVAAGNDLARVTSFASMALHPNGATRLVQIRAPEPGFPFYGEIETEPANQWATLHDGRNLVADPALLVALDAEIGDSISIGATRYRIAATIQKMPGDVEVASSFAPRVFVSNSTLGETELLGFGARVDYDAFFRIPDPLVAEAFVEGHRDELRERRVRARTLEDQQERMQEALGRLSDFLGLIGVFALLLGGIGVASAMTAYMARKADSVAVLRCLGATARQVFGIYLLQAAVMGLAGAAVGVVLGTAVQWVLPRMLEGLLPVDVVIRPDGIAVVTGLAVGVWTAVAFALLPLLQVRNVSPLSALRRRVDPIAAGPRDRIRIAAWTALLLSVLGLVLLQAGDPEVGFAVTAGILGTLLALWLVARLVMSAMRQAPRNGLVYPVRQGVANLYRPGNQTGTVILALGFGVFLIGTLVLTQANLLRPLEVDTDSQANLLFFDVQQDQVAGVEEELAAVDATLLQSVPIVPMRIASINGVPAREILGYDDDELPPAPPQEGFEEENDEEGPSRWAVRREYSSTFRDTLNPSETQVAGEWERDTPSRRGLYRLSLDRDVADELEVGIGDLIEWDVQGTTIPTEITSLRRVDWARLEPNFFAVFEPAALSEAPQMWVMLARDESQADRAIAQREIVRRFSNVSALDLTLVQRALNDVIGRVSLVIRFLAGFSVATGFIVLLGAIATGRLQRIRESVLLKTLGATRRQIAAILVTEYAMLGLLAALVGAGLALAAGWGLARWLFDVEFGFEILPMLGLGAAVAVLSALIGLSASRDVFSTTPMEAIRDE